MTCTVCGQFMTGSGTALATLGHELTAALARIAKLEAAGNALSMCLLVANRDLRYPGHPDACKDWDALMKDSI